MRWLSREPRKSNQAPRGLPRELLSVPYQMSGLNFGRLTLYTDTPLFLPVSSRERSQAPEFLQFMLLSSTQSILLIGAVKHRFETDVRDREQKGSGSTHVAFLVGMLGWRSSLTGMRRCLKSENGQNAYGSTGFCAEFVVGPFSRLRNLPIIVRIGSKLQWKWTGINPYLVESENVKHVDLQFEPRRSGIFRRAK